MEFRFTEEIRWSLPFITFIFWQQIFPLWQYFDLSKAIWMLIFVFAMLSWSWIWQRYTFLVSFNQEIYMYHQLQSITVIFFSKEGFMYLSEKQSYREETGEIFCLLVLLPQWLPRLRLLQVTASSQEFHPSPSQESSAGDWIQSGAAGTCTSIPMGCWHCSQWLNSTQQRWSQCSFISEE